MAKVNKSDSEWREVLSAEQYRVTREKGTELPFSGEYNHCDTPGQYRCVCCGAKLFSSEHKFNAGCGWPSFDRVQSADAVVEAADDSLGVRRVEVLCEQCGAHLGHVFPDGPTSTGLRYCINSVALTLTEEDKDDGSE